MVLKQNKLRCYFTATVSSYFQSDQFGRVLNYYQEHPRRCRLEEKNDKRSILIDKVDSIREAISIFEKM